MRKPFALANWKMAMTIAETISFIRKFLPLVEGLAEEVDIVICPPFTALYVASLELKGSRVQLGAQNLHPGPGQAWTGEISAQLLVDVGCEWVMLGHWERRRNFGENDELVNRKVRAAFEAGLRPILLVGEPADYSGELEIFLGRQLEALTQGCSAEEIERAVFVYEPEGAIGVERPASPEHIGKGCAILRERLREKFGAAAEKVRIIYGGSVSPEFAPAILSLPDVDGLGATRKGRNPEAFASLVKSISQWKCAWTKRG
jgi:triosephosphate isomerase